MSNRKMVIVASHGWNPDWERLHDEDDVQESLYNRLVKILTKLDYNVGDISIIINAFERRLGNIR